jgi:hypothetical protein
MKVHIITPFTRFHNLPALLENFKQADEFVALVTEDQIYGHTMSLDPVRYYIVDNLGEADGAIAYRRVNRFIAHSTEMNEIVDDDYYMFMCDDDALEDNFINEIKKHNEDVLIVSLKRGDTIPTGDGMCPHGTTPLIAHPDNMKVGLCSWEQAIVKGKILKQIRFVEDNACADGVMLEWLTKTFPAMYLPELFIKFNFLQPGRWTK